MRGGQLLFVYGTLRPGGRNAWRMGHARHLGAATIAGRLYMSAQFPALLNGHEVIVGDLWRLADGQLAALDRFEGPDYVRRRKRVTLASGATILAWTYVSTRTPHRTRCVAGGDLLAATA